MRNNIVNFRIRFMFDNWYRSIIGRLHCIHSEDDNKLQARLRHHDS